MDTFRGGATATPVVEEGYRRRVLGMEPGALMSILIILVIIILLLMLFNMSSDSDSLSPGKGGEGRTQAAFFNPLNNTMRNNARPPVVTTATTTRAL